MSLENMIRPGAEDTRFIWIRRDTGQWLNTTSNGYETFNASNWDKYLATCTDVTANDVNGSQIKRATPPTGANTEIVHDLIAVNRISGTYGEDELLGIGESGPRADSAALAAAGLDAVLIEAGITPGATLVNDTGTQLASINARQALALAISALAARLAGAGGTSITFTPAGKSTPSRIAATVDGVGNRSAVTLKVPD